MVLGTAILLRRNFDEILRIGQPVLKPSLKVMVLLIIGVGLSSCGSTPRNGSSGAHINNKTKFSSKAYGVAASPRVTTSRKVKRGGGRAQIGKRYKVRGKWYTPREQPGYVKVGQASWYGPNFHGRLTANGEIYDQYALSAAHPTFPLPSYARVTNLANGNSVVVRVNDRGPYANGRVIDMSSKAADLLDYKRAGTAKVRVEYLGKARLDGRDERFLLASFKPGRGYRPNRPGILPGGLPGFRPDVMIASNRPKSKVGALPVFSFVKAPFPKERPVFSGGIPLNIQAYLQPGLINPATAGSFATTVSFQPVLKRKVRKNRSRRLEPLSKSRFQKVKERFIVSSYVADQRVRKAHQAAEAAQYFATRVPIDGDRIRNYWKRNNENNRQPGWPGKYSDR